MKSLQKRARRREKKRNKADKQREEVGLPIHKVHITDHALVRYFERCLEIDISAIKKEMLADGRDEMIKKLRSGKFPLGNGAKLVVVEGNVVTVS